MARRRRESWRPDIAGVLICVVVFGLISGAPFTSNPAGFLMLCIVGGGLVGYLQGRPDRKRRLIRWIHARFSIPTALALFVVALMLRWHGPALLMLTLGGSAAVRYFQRRPEQRARITGAVHNCASRAARSLKGRASRRRLR